MRRRDFLTVFGGSLAWPLGARAQQPVLPVVGFLNPTSSTLHEFNADAFRNGLPKRSASSKAGMCMREYRWGEGDYNRLPALAAELVARQVAVIAATGDVGSA